MTRRNTLGAIADRLEAIEKIFREFINSIRATEKREAEKKDKPTEVRGEIWLPENIENKHDTEQKKQYATQRWIARGTWAATVAAIIYAGIAADQTHWIRQATIATQKQLSDFEAVEAAQIAIEFMPTVKMGKPGQGLLVDGNIDVTNIGLTTAVDFTAMGYVWIRNLKPPTPGVPGIVNESANVTPFNVRGVLLGSGRTNHYPIGIQVGQVDEIHQGEWQSGIWVDYRFSDVFGHPYSGRECFMVNPSNVLEFIRCPQNTFR